MFIWVIYIIRNFHSEKKFTDNLFHLSSLQLSGHERIFVYKKVVILKGNTKDSPSLYFVKKVNAAFMSL